MPVRYYLLLIMDLVGCLCKREGMYHVDQNFVNKMCPAEQIKFQTTARSVIKCVQLCSVISECQSLVFYHGNNTCFGMKSVNPFISSYELSGAVFYKPVDPTTTNTEPPTTTTTETTSTRTSTSKVTITPTTMTTKHPSTMTMEPPTTTTIVTLITMTTEPPTSETTEPTSITTSTSTVTETPTITTTEPPTTTVTEPTSTTTSTSTVTETPSTTTTELPTTTVTGPTSITTSPTTVTETPTNTTTELPATTVTEPTSITTSTTTVTETPTTTTTALPTTAVTGPTSITTSTSTVTETPTTTTTELPTTTATEPTSITTSTTTVTETPTTTTTEPPTTTVTEPNSITTSASIVTETATTTTEKPPTSTVMTSSIPVCDGAFPMVADVADSQLSSSSDFSKDYKPYMGKLDYELGYWCSKWLQIGEYIQVDFLSLRVAKAVITQGSSDISYDEWVTNYTLSISIDCVTFTTILDSDGVEQIFPGNTDKDSHVTNNLEPSVPVRCLRIIPQSWFSLISVRFEVMGCRSCLPCSQSCEFEDEF